MRRLVVLLVAGVLFAPATALGAGGTYTVAECDSANRDDADAQLHASDAYSAKNNCGDPSDGYSLQVESRKPAATDHRGLIRFATPSPDLGIVGVRVEAKLRGDDGSHPRLWLADRNFNELHRIAASDSPGDGFHRYSWNTSGPGARQFIASLTCEKEDGCPQSDLAKTWIRNVRLIVADYADPELGELGGSLLEGGWVSGNTELEAPANDSGSGVDAITASVSGTQIAVVASDCATVPGSSLAATLSVCPESQALPADADTTIAPFRDGANDVTVCATDFGTNNTCSHVTVLVDNNPPQLAFENSQSPRNPELVRVGAADAGSGVGTGSISYRPVGGSAWTPAETVVEQDKLSAYVDSTSVPAGDYEFMATASDVAGNSSSTTSRSDGQPMVLAFPLKAGTRLDAHLVPGGERRETVAYGRDSKVTGRLLNASGKPIARTKVKVVEHFAPGALIDKRVRVLRTDRGGFFGERIPAGPSRTIVASYAGSKRYLNDATRAGRLVVQSKAGLRTSRRRVKEGRAVVFKGTVRHKGARIPPGGKLIELQVRDGKFWNTVRQAFYTRPDGRYRLRYRFRADYTRNARFHFRVKIVREQGWPYRAPVRTRVRKVVVVAR